MVRLEDNKIRKGFRKKFAKETQNVDETVDSKNPQKANGELEKFSSYVLRVMAQEAIPPSPSNFQIYFEKLLDNKPLSFKKRINDFMEVETTSSDEHRAKMETEIKEGFDEIKSIMNVVSTVYKNLNVMDKIVEKRKTELKSSTSQLSASTISSALIEDLKKLSDLTAKQMGTIRYHYDKTAVILKGIESKAIFDSRLGVYNKRYLISAIEYESKSIKQFGHKSSLVLAKVKDSVSKSIRNSKDRMILTRNISKLLLKTSRKSDVVTHYGKGVFGLVMKHTDVENAKKACERISDLIYSTNFFIGDAEIDTDIELAIVCIKPDGSSIDAISSARDSLWQTGKNLKPYIVCEL